MSRKDREKQRRRAQRARQNGALSKGPVTPEGKRNSSLNSLRHGLAAKSVIIIDGESREALQEVIDGALQSHKPQNAWEAILLDNAISAAWRSRRAASFETAITNLQMQIDAPQIKKEFSLVDPITRQAFSTRNLDQSSVSPLQLARYEAELSRSTDRWITILQHVQSERRSQSEPTSAVPSPESPDLQKVTEPRA
ncbi:MAG TPA: hypothetical protein VM120_07050 [Bryobacteraceae bacterium]|nr:hypothetical protein [Bryobacteraceae bacterium]